MGSRLLSQVIPTLPFIIWETNYVYERTKYCFTLVGWAKSRLNNEQTIKQTILLYSRWWKTKTVLDRSLSPAPYTPAKYSDSYLQIEVFSAWPPFKLSKLKSINYSLSWQFITVSFSICLFAGYGLPGNPRCMPAVVPPRSPGEGIFSSFTFGCGSTLSLALTLLRQCRLYPHCSKSFFWCLSSYWRYWRKCSLNNKLSNMSGQYSPYWRVV